QTDLFSQRQRLNDTHLLLRFFTDGNHITSLDLVRSDVDNDTVHGQRLVRYQLTCFSTSRAKTHTTNDVIETCFQQLQERFTGVTFAALCFSEITAELTLENTVHALHFLLFTQLVTVVGSTCTGSAAMLTWLGIQLALGVQRA